MEDIAIVIPTYNSSRTITACLESIVDQSKPCKELVIVDKNSVDGTAEIAKAKGATVVRTNANRSAARNIGVSQCTSPGVLFVDADMILSKRLISESGGGLDKHDALIIPEVSFGIGFWAKCKALDKRLSIGNELAEAPRCFRRTAFLSVGGYATALEAGEDWDLANRLRLHGLRIGRTRCSISHNEGDLKLFSVLKKKYGYGKTFGKYLRNHPRVGLRQVNPFSRIVIPTLRIVGEDPAHGAGLLILKSLEFCAAGVGGLENIRHASES